MNLLGVAFLFALVAGTAMQMWLALRQARFVAAHSDRVPSAFAERVTLEEHQKAAAYTSVKIRFEIVTLLWGALIVAAWTLGGVLELLDGVLRDWQLGTYWSGVLLVACFGLIGALLEMPFSLWKTFGIEASFGFNRTTPRRFVLDLLLGLAVSVALGGPLLLAALWLMENAGANWWLAVWALWMAFSLTVSWAFPRFIAPLFNRFSPLEDDSLRQRLERLLDRCGFASDGLFVMDGSKRSAHGNAYFTGLGRNKRIVFFDTLLKQLEPTEVEAVLAHELGHYHHKHVHKGLVMMSVFSFAGLALLGWLSAQEWFYSGLGVSQSSDAAALILFMLASPVFMVFLQPFFTRLSRRHEFEADAFAANKSDASALVRGLVKLYRENASSLVSDPLYAAFHYSHPPAPERVARLETQGA